MTLHSVSPGLTISSVKSLTVFKKLISRPSNNTSVFNALCECTLYNHNLSRAVVIRRFLKVTDFILLASTNRKNTVSGAIHE